MCGNDKGIGEGILRGDGAEGNGGDLDGAAEGVEGFELIGSGGGGGDSRDFSVSLICIEKNEQKDGENRTRERNRETGRYNNGREM